MFETIQHFFTFAMPDMPPQSWWVAVILLLVLGVGAAIDLVKGTLPDPLIFFGMVATVAAKGLYVDWPFAAHQMIWGLLAAAAVWGINEITLRLTKRDLFDLSDAKWTMLAVTGFGFLPMLVAWVVGLVLGSIWMMVQKAARRKRLYTRFAPFVLVGLIVGIWAVRLNDWKTLLGFHPS